MNRNSLSLSILVIVGLLIIVDAFKTPYSPWKEAAKAYQNLKRHEKKNITNESGFLNQVPEAAEIGSAEYQQFWFTQQVDHFSFAGTPKTFQQRYLVRKNFWDPRQKGPIFFYCGNEGPIEMFYNNSGFLNNDLGNHFSAMIVYMEHRYFGDSWPFGDEKTSFEKQNIGYLNSNQALADFANFLQWFQTSEGCEDCPIISFGGSYGGMLSAWFRMKYPNVVTGALAMSAPIYYFANRQGLQYQSFYKLATNNFRGNNSNSVIREAYRRLDVLMEGKGTMYTYLAVNSGFQVCTTFSNTTGVQAIKNWMDNAFLYISMLNYPYETQFLKNLPGWPANTSAATLNGVSVNATDFDLFNAIRIATDVYYNWGQNYTCNEVFSDSSSDQDMSGWDILACGDMVMPMEADGVNDMFSPFKWDNQAYSDFCFEKFGIRPQYNWTLDFYGGRNDKEMQGFSNIFFSNGMLDPWSGGSPVEYLSSTLQVEYISASAHHLDLRSPNPQDPASVAEARSHEIIAIQTWIQEYNANIQKELENKMRIEEF